MNTEIHQIISAIEANFAHAGQVGIGAWITVVLVIGAVIYLTRVRA